MKFLYRLTKLDNWILEDMWKDERELVTILVDVMYWKKSVKQSRNVVIDKPTPEREEFLKAYRKLKAMWSYDDTLIKKYHTAIIDFPHKKMMEKLDEYSRHLEAFDFKKPVMLSVFLNQKRYKEDYEVSNVDFTQKWKDDMLREQKVPKTCIDAIMTENNAWESTHWKVREMTSLIFQAIIDKYYKPKLQNKTTTK